MSDLSLHKLILIFTGVFVVNSSASQEWPDWRGSNRDGIWKETGIVKKFKNNTIPLKWSIPCGSGYSGPTVSGGKVYMTDLIEKPEASERVLCVDANNGKVIWTYSYASRYGNVSYPNGPRASVVISDGKAYSLGTMGHLFCFDAQTGSVLWQHDLNREYQIIMPIWGIASTPLIFENTIILQIGGSNGASVLALDKNSGKELWRAIDDKISYSAPILIRQAGKPPLLKKNGHGWEKVSIKPMPSIVSLILHSLKMTAFTVLTVMESCVVSDSKPVTGYGRIFPQLPETGGPISILSSMDNKPGCSMNTENFSLPNFPRKE